ncbi:MAG TPA: hypothetical protein DEQ43_04800 [Nocardioides bacterium]|nr:hypothetical protein [Nocardioides sp.]
MSTPFPPLAQLPGRPCPIAASLEVVGERWALLVVRELALGSTRFTDIVRGTGAPRDRIAARLKVLEEAGVAQELARELVALVDACEAARYAPAETSLADDTLAERVNEAIARLRR